MPPLTSPVRRAAAASGGPALPRGAPAAHARARRAARSSPRPTPRPPRYGGLTRAWGLEPDIVTLGKSLGGGIPVGAYGMTGELRDHMERHRASHGRVTGLATGGTTYANPLSLAAVVATLSEIHTPAAFERTAALGARLADGIEAAAARHELPWRAHRLGGRSGICLEPELPRDAEDAARSLDAELIDARRLHLANRGVWDAIASAGPAASFAHTEADVDAYVAALDAFLDDLVGT